MKMGIELPPGVNPNEKWKVGEKRWVTIAFESRFFGSLLTGIHFENYRKWFRRVTKEGQLQILEEIRLDEIGLQEARAGKMGADQLSGLATRTGRPVRGVQILVRLNRA